MNFRAALDKSNKAKSERRLLLVKMHMLCLTFRTSNACAFKLMDYASARLGFVKEPGLKVRHVAIQIRDGRDGTCRMRKCA